MFSFNAANLTVNNAHIIETEIFVYNLGTMFYIDEVLYQEILINSTKTASVTTTTAEVSTSNSQKPLTFTYSTVADVEPVPSEITGSNDDADSQDVLFYGDAGTANSNEDDASSESSVDTLYIPRK